MRQAFRAVVAGTIMMIPGCSSDDSVAPRYTPSFVAGYASFTSGAAAGVTVDLMRGDWDGGIPPGRAWTVAATTCANSKGYFSFRYNHADFVDYGVTVRQNSYPTLGTFEAIEAGETKYVQLVLSFSATDSIATRCP